jgi:hypothetical protein
MLQPIQNNKILLGRFYFKILSGKIPIQSSKKLHEDIKINSNNPAIKGKNFMKIG